jgi:hypothetical protein
MIPAFIFHSIIVATLGSKMVFQSCVVGSTLKVPEGLP